MTQLSIAQHHVDVQGHLLLVVSVPVYLVILLCEVPKQKAKKKIL